MRYSIIEVLFLQRVKSQKAFSRYSVTIFNFTTENSLQAQNKEYMGFKIILCEIHRHKRICQNSQSSKNNLESNFDTPMGLSPPESQHYLLKLSRSHFRILDVRKHRISATYRCLIFISLKKRLTFLCGPFSHTNKAHLHF